MHDPAHIDTAILGARPKAIAALLRYFRDLDTAEEAFQEACLRALQTWPHKGPPRNPTAWLIMVGRNAALDTQRRIRSIGPLPDADALTDARDDLTPERLDESPYGDDILRLLFMCGHPALPATQQIALALRIVSGLTVEQIAKAFLVSPAAMEQRITRAKRAIAKIGVEFDTPGASERRARLAAVSTMIYLIFNEGYGSTPDTAAAREALADEAIRLGRLLLRLFPTDPEVFGLLALMLLQQSRAPARFDANGDIVLLDEQDRSRWNRAFIDEGRLLLQRASVYQDPGPYQLQAAIAALHARATRPEDTLWKEIDSLYQALEALQPSPVVTLNRAVAVWKLRGPEAALEMIDPLKSELDAYFYLHGLRGALLKELDRFEEARDALNRAISLANSVAEAKLIRRELDSLVIA
ncbi:MAG TPA: RNA polymerase sigma factor [Steroidobacteraceae bacterium]|nr:RNA polymerase sigma factor [Steroidobacteraceae bacterium]